MLILAPNPVIPCPQPQAPTQHYAHSSLHNHAAFSSPHNKQVRPDTATSSTRAALHPPQRPHCDPSLLHASPA